MRLGAMSSNHRHESGHRPVQVTVIVDQINIGSAGDFERTAVEPFRDRVCSFPAAVSKTKGQLLPRCRHGNDTRIGKLLTRCVNDRAGKVAHDIDTFLEPFADIPRDAVGKSVCTPRQCKSAAFKNGRKLRICKWDMVFSAGLRRTRDIYSSD